MSFNKIISCTFFVVVTIMACADDKNQEKTNNDSKVESKVDTEEEVYPVSGGKDFMMSEVQKELSKQDGKFYWYLSRNRLAGLEFSEAEQQGLSLVELKATKGDEMIRLGLNERAIVELETAKSMLEKSHASDPNFQRFMYIVLKKLGLAYMRMGEQQNCLDYHSPEACILPFRGKGIHKFKQPSQMAIQCYTQMLEMNPEDLTARYLLNLAYMTIGEHPNKVPKQYLIDAKMFEKGPSFPMFKDVASSYDLDINELSGTSILDDFDNDGDLDLMVSSWGFSDQLRYFKNEEGKFVEQTKNTGLLGLIGGLCMKPADYNNDGFLDVLVLRGAWYTAEVGLFPNSLIRNNGDGTFTDVTVEAGIFSKHPTQAAAWGDYNNDGHLDLYIANESSKSEPHPNEFYTNNGDGTFTNDSDVFGGGTVGFFKGAVWGDIDNDGLIDLYLSNLTGNNLLYKNLGASTGGRWLFQEIGKEAGVTEPKESFPCWFFDYDNDGFLDIFSASYPSLTLIHRYAEDFARELIGIPSKSATAKLYRNKGDGTFEDITDKVGLNAPMFAMGSNFGDLDSDGFLDFYIGNGEPNLESIIPNRLFWNREGKKFDDISFKSGFAHIQKGHGVSFGDIDHDGDQDVYAVMGGAFEGDNYYNVLFENPGFNNDWIILELEGRETNRKAIGARVEVNYIGANGQRSVHRMVDSGSSFGNNPLRQEIGLGKGVKKINYIQIYWPGSKETERVTNVVKNTFYKIIEGEPEAIKRPFIKLR